eukprot:gene25555-biopygen1461
MCNMYQDTGAGVARAIGHLLAWVARAGRGHGVGLVGEVPAGGGGACGACGAGGAGRACGARGACEACGACGDRGE